MTIFQFANGRRLPEGTTIWEWVAMHMKGMGPVEAFLFFTKPVIWFIFWGNHPNWPSQMARLLKYPLVNSGITMENHND